MKKEELQARYEAARNDKAFQEFLRKAMIPPADRLAHAK